MAVPPRGGGWARGGGIDTGGGKDTKNHIMADCFQSLLAALHHEGQGVLQVLPFVCDNYGSRETRQNQTPTYKIKIRS